MNNIIWGNTIVKNEDRYIWFAIKSVINHLDKLIIYDTGSTDLTVEIIEDLIKEYPDKIIFEKKGLVSKSALTALRQEMLEKTKSDWFLLLDGDEVWWEDSIKSVTNEIKANGDDLYALVSPVINLIGDIYHYQESAAGEYKILGQKGHFNIRAINRKIPGLHLENDYPLEGYIEKSGKLIQSVQKKLEFIDKPLLHFSFLNRSTNPDHKTLHRNKIKTELGIKFAEGFKYPEVFSLSRPNYIKDPFKKMSLSYKIRAGLITPLKKIRRRIK